MSEEQLLQGYNFIKWENEEVIALNQNNCFVNLYVNSLIEISGNNEESRNLIRRRFEHMLKQEGLRGIKLEGVR